MSDTGPDPANRALLARRWPALAAQLELAALPREVAVMSGRETTLYVDGIQLTSRHDRGGEAQLLAGQVPADAVSATLYGTALGDVQRVLLQRSELKKLTVVVLNPGLFALVLAHTDQADWLADPRVELVGATDQDPVGSWVALPAELELATTAAGPLRDRLRYVLDSDWVNARFLESHREQIDAAPAALAPYAGDADVRSLFGTLAPEREAFVIAPGPSLTQHADYLKHCRAEPHPPLLIAVDTALKPLADMDIAPDLAVTLDAKITPARLPAAAPLAATTLVYFPLTRPDLLDSWPGPRALAIGTSPSYDRLHAHFDRGALYTNGSVIHPAIDLAVKLGAQTVVLFGADFAFSGDRTHAGWDDGALGVGFEGGDDHTVNGRGERVRTLRNFQAYRIGVEHFIAAHPEVRWLNASRDGAVIAGTAYYPDTAT